MKAAVLRGKHLIALEDKPEPSFGETEVLIAVRAVAICGSDLHGFEGKIPQRRPIGLTMGHEFSGVVAAVGRQVTRVKPGDRVAVDPQISCGQCPPCRKGWRNLCEQVQILGSAMRGYREGANAEFIAVPAENVYPIAPAVSFAEAALGEPVGNAVHLIGRVGELRGATVVVIGAGTIGALAAQAAKGSGAGTVIVIEPSAFKRGLVRQTGADLTIDPLHEDAEAIVKQATAGLGAPVVLECCGVQSTYQLAIRLACKRGVIGALGYIDEQVAFPMRPLIFSELSVIGSTGFYWPVDPALEMIADGRVQVKPIITHRFPLAEAQRAYETAQQPDAIKVVIEL